MQTYAQPGIHQVQTYRGIKKGWLNIGRPRSKEEAIQLCKWEAKAQPNYNYRVQQNPLELFNW
tara:strand:- start:373 stop:561 length:189 start_codon:yes stop_codon:yes gene_type:complete